MNSTLTKEDRRLLESTLSEGIVGMSASIRLILATATDAEQPSITRIGEHHGKAFVVYLSDGRKVTVGRNSHTIGEAWLEISKQANIQAAAASEQPPQEWMRKCAKELCAQLRLCHQDSEIADAAAILAKHAPDVAELKRQISEMGDTIASKESEFLACARNRDEWVRDAGKLQRELSDLLGKSERLAGVAEIISKQTIKFNGELVPTSLAMDAHKALDAYRSGAKGKL